MTPYSTTSVEAVTTTPYASTSFGATGTPSVVGTQTLPTLNSFL